MALRAVSRLEDVRLLVLLEQVRKLLLLLSLVAVLASTGVKALKKLYTEVSDAEEVGLETEEINKNKTDSKI